MTGITESKTFWTLMVAMACVTVMACFKLIEGKDAVQYVMMLFGGGVGKWIFDGASSSVPQDVVKGIGVNGHADEVGK